MLNLGTAMVLAVEGSIMPCIVSDTVLPEAGQGVNIATWMP